MKQFLSRVTLSRPFGYDHYCRFLNRRETIVFELSVRFFLHVCRAKHET